MPKPTLCPKCHKRPRRRPGDPCNVCHRAHFKGWRQAKSKAKRQALEIPRFARPLAERKRYIVTAAQNDTRVDAAFFASLKTAAGYYKAERVVIPIRYKNPTSIAEGRRQLSWDAAVTPYLYNQRKRLNPNLVLAADVKIQPTASSPLSGFEGLTGAESCILGHPKLQLRTVAVPSGRFPKILTTTGVCTVPNYSDTKAGKLGEFHYTLGALLVEIDGKEFHIRQLLGDKADGSICDLDKRFTGTGVTKAPRPPTITIADTHVSVTDAAVDAATYGPGGIVDVCNPETIVWHDIHNAETTNPHEDDNPFAFEARRLAHRVDVKAELQQMVDFANARAKGRDAVIVNSNHHDWLERWVTSVSKRGLRAAGGNMRLWLELASHMMDTAKMTPGGSVWGDPFEYMVKKLGATGNIRCLKADESFKRAGVEHGMHGHLGANGSKGTLLGFSKLGVKSNTGHGHTPGIEGGAWRSGTSTGKQSYQHGPDSTLSAHILTHANGKRQLIIVVVVDDVGKWRLKP